MRARYPDHTGTVQRGEIRIHYDVYGEGDTTLLFLPAWAITHSQLWKAQVAHFARHYRVVTYDPRGNGRSDHPTHPDAYKATELVGDAFAVLDAADVDTAVLVGNSFGTTLAYLMAATAPQRVRGMVLIGTTLNLSGRSDDPLSRAFARFDEVLDSDEGWAKYNCAYWQRDFPGFVRFFVEQAFTEPHCTKPIEDGIAWGLETTPEALAATVAARAAQDPMKTAAKLRSLLPQIRCPSIVIHGSADAITPLHQGQVLAEALGSELVVLEGACHCPQVRHPVDINRRIHAFVQGLGSAGPPRDELAPAPRSRVDGKPPRILYLSSPIGLGHARRDLAIARELRALVPGARIDWLAQDPVTRFLAAHDERVHPASQALASESSHLEQEADEHDLHVFQALRRMDEILVANFMVFQELMEQERYDLVVGDEAWEVDHFLHEEPQLKRTPFVWLTDFVGYVPMPSGGEDEARITADYNLEMIRHVERHRHIRDRAIFVGNPEDVVDIPFGPGMPSIRMWTEHHYAFSDYVLGFDPEALRDRRALRAELGYDAEQPVCVAAVGGSAVGHGLLRRLAASHAIARNAIPGLRTVLVTGPRIDPASLPDMPDLDKRPFVPDLHRHLAACDLAVVQGGLATTMELVALQRPFLYFPLRNHFEQQIHVRHRLTRYGAGEPMDFASATPEIIADAITRKMTEPVRYGAVGRDGHRRAAELIASALG